MLALHHLVPVVVREDGSVAPQRGAAPEDHLRVEAQGSQRVRLLQPVAPHSAPVAFWDAGGDGEGVVPVALLPGDEPQGTLPAAVVTATALELNIDFTAPEEALPDLCYDLPGNNLHLHSFVGPLGRTVAAEDVIIRDGPRLHVSVGAVLPEILSYPHSPFVLAVKDKNTHTKKKHTF